MAPTGISSLRLYGLPISRSSHHSSSSTSSLPTPLLTSSTSPSDSASTAAQSFTHPTDSMPPPGPEHYETRRALWLTQPESKRCQPYPPSPSTSRAKLEVLLNQEGKADNDSVWNSGLRGVWKGLVGGGRLRRRLPLALVIKILKAGWQHDGTWPMDSVTNPPSPVPPLQDLPMPAPLPLDDTLREESDT